MPTLSPTHALLSVVIPVAYILALDPLSQLQVGTITQGCTYPVYRAMPTIVGPQNGEPPGYYSISMYLTSPATPGVFASLTAPALAIIYNYPVAARSVVQSALLIAFYTLWTLFLATPVYANHVAHDASVGAMFVVIIAYMTLQYRTLRLQDVRDRPAELSLVVAAAALFGTGVTVFLASVPAYPFEVVAYVCVVSFTPLLHLYRNAAGIA